MKNLIFLLLLASPVLASAREASLYARQALGLAGGATFNDLVMDVIEPRTTPTAAIVKVRVHNEIRTYLFLLNPDGSVAEVEWVLNPHDLIILNQASLTWADPRARMISLAVCIRDGGLSIGAPDGVNLRCAGGKHDGFYIPVPN